ncbi:MAG: succinate dehydrogenase, hydrophobic membrane anchor protein [Sphingomonadaceae bacterium]|nr:succinate dehydrogenase, hydrophobic membrane anchor protein [Sphingomonadaceae bacterium]
MAKGTALGRVRGLGSARSGSSHWWAQRVTAFANIALMTWFIVSLVRLPDLTYFTVANWLRQPSAAIPMVLFVASVFYHFRLGVQVMIEDYAHEEGWKLSLVLALNFYVAVAGAVALFAILKLAFGGSVG